MHAKVGAVLGGGLLFGVLFLPLPAAHSASQASAYAKVTVYVDQRAAVSTAERSERLDSQGQIASGLDLWERAVASAGWSRSDAAGSLTALDGADGRTELHQVSIAGEERICVITWPD